MAEYLKNGIGSSLHGGTGGGFRFAPFGRQNTINHKDNLHKESADKIIRAFCFPSVGFICHNQRAFSGLYIKGPYNNLNSFSD